jgi:hypothetical protein
VRWPEWLRTEALVFGVSKYAARISASVICLQGNSYKNVTIPRKLFESEAIWEPWSDPICDVGGHDFNLLCCCCVCRPVQMVIAVMGV